MKKMNPQNSADILPILLGGPAAIIAQEKAGQRELVGKGRDAQLPAECSKECRAALEAAGVGFFELVDGDPMFRHCSLPPGWEIKPTDHDMYSDLLDSQGRKRASVGYKAAFYDRWANLSACRRFDAGYSKDDYGDPDAEVFPCIRDGGKIVWRGVAMKDERDYKRLPEKKENDEIGWCKNAWGGVDCVHPSDYCSKVAHKQLSTLYPDWVKLTAYWDIVPVWPESLSAPIPGEEYRLHVSLYQANGNFSDSGSQTTRKAKTDAEAMKKLKADAEKAFKGRYKVEASVTCGERKVGTFTIDLPVPRREFRENVYRDNQGRRQYGEDFGFRY